MHVFDNENATAEIRTKCFERMAELSKQEDVNLRHDLVWRIGMINGYDQEKFDLLPLFMEWGTPYFLRDYFNHFDSAHLLFVLVKESFMAAGMGVDMQLFNSALYSQYYKNRTSFDFELTELLTDDLAIARYAGIMVMFGRSGGGSYEIDLLTLSEIKQLRVIETLLPLPMNIEELMPLVLTLRNSVYETVKEKLTQELIQLIAAYGEHVLKMAKRFLDNSKESDQIILNKLEEATKEYVVDREERSQISELNPLLNELEYVEQYFRLEHEKQTEMTEQAQSKSVFAAIAKNIHVIRGKGFRSEESEGVSMMGDFEFSRLIDMRYYINPEKYEWQFKMNALRKNYKPAAKS
jgi:hypothetical protein